MHTKSSKLVLSPLADAVSTLIMIISESEISGTATPDLSKLSQAVDAQVCLTKQIKNLVNVSTKITNQSSSDSILKLQMPKGCKIVLEGSALLLHSTSQLFNNPVSHEGRQGLLEAVKGILDGTSAILEAFDEFEMRKIFNALKSTRDLLSLIQSQSLTPESEAAYVHILRRTAQAFNSASRLSGKRSKDIISVALAKHLDDAVMAFTRRTVHYLEACELQVQFEKSSDSKALFLVLVKELESLSLTIEKIVSCKDIEDYYPILAKDITKNELSMLLQKLREERDSLINEPLAQKWKLDPHKTQNDSLLIMEFSKEVAASIRNSCVFQNEENKLVQSNLKESFMELCEGLKKTIEGSKDQLNAEKLSHDGRAYIQAIDQCVNVMYTTSITGHLVDVFIVIGDLLDSNDEYCKLIRETCVGALRAQLLNQTTNGIPDLALRFKAQSSQLSTLMTHMLKNISESHEAYGALLTARGRIQIGQESILESLQMYSRHPENLILSNMVQSFLKEFTELASELQKITILSGKLFSVSELLQAASIL